MARLGKSCVLIFISFFLNLQWDVCSSLHLNIAPDTVVNGSYRFIDFLCEVGADGAKNVSLLQISKNQDVPIATIRPGSKVDYNAGDHGKFWAQGSLDKDTNSSYIQMVIHNPQMEDGGMYKCTLYFLNQAEILMDESVTSKLVVREYSDEDTLRHKVTTLEKIRKQDLDKESTVEKALLTRLVALEKKVTKNDLKGTTVLRALLARLKALRKTVTKSDLKESTVEKALLTRLVALEKKVTKSDSKESDLQAKITSLEEGSKNMSMELTRLRKDKEEMETKMIELVNKDSSFQVKIGEMDNAHKNMMKEVTRLAKDKNVNMSPKVTGLVNTGKATPAFNAMLSKTVNLVQGAAIVFDKALLRDGASGYDPNTGVFTVPQAGLYFFYLSATVKNPGAELLLVVNEDEVVGSHTHASSDEWDQSTINVLLYLQVGDKVNPKVGYLYGHTPLLDNGVFSMFGGHLVH